MTVGIDQPAYNITEGAGLLNVCAILTGDADREVLVTLTTIATSAQGIEPLATVNLLQNRIVVIANKLHCMNYPSHTNRNVLPENNLYSNTSPHSFIPRPRGRPGNEATAPI